MAERFGIGEELLYRSFYLRANDLDEGTLRRSLFEHTGGSYPEARSILTQYRCTTNKFLAHYEKRYQSFSATNRYVQMIYEVFQRTNLS